MKILSITVESRHDDYHDTSYLGEYTNDYDTWSIDRETSTFCHKEEVKSRIIDTLEVWIGDFEENERQEAARFYRNRLEKIKKIDIKTTFIGRGEYKYFRPYAGGEKPGSPEYIKSAIQNYERMESLNNGNWCFLGIVAKATIQTDRGTLQHITSDGRLWGIESDAGDYLNEVAIEEIASLKDKLFSLGFSSRAIQYAANKWDGEINYK